MRFWWCDQDCECRRATLSPWQTLSPVERRWLWLQMTPSWFAAIAPQRWIFRCVEVYWCVGTTTPSTLVDCPTRWSLWYGYLDFYVDHLFRYPDDLRNIVQQCATSTHDRVHRAFAGDEEGWGGAEDEAVSTFGRSTWYDRQLGKQFLDTYVYKKVAGPHIAIGGRWWGKCSQWRLGPARHLLGEMLSLNNWTSWLCFRNWKGMNTNSTTLWSSTPTWTSSVLATLGPTMQGERVDT